MLKLRTLFTSISVVILSATMSLASGFAGTWVGTGKNNFDVSYGETIIMSVSGSSISGSYESSQAAGKKWKISGSITEAGKASVTVFGIGNSVLNMTLKGDTLSYVWEWGTGKLERQ